MNDEKQLNMADRNLYRINREHKDGLFRAAFREKEDLLSLYNAMNDTNYQNPEELIVYTLEDAVYIGIKNDISFLVGEMLNLYEHQSTRNPNMPIRGLLYLARNFESYIEQNHLNLYSRVLQKFPLPQYYVFYNGLEHEKDRTILRLSDAFPQFKGKEPCLECTAVLLNINYGHNVVLMEKCRQLKDYATFIFYIRRNQKAGLSMQQAVDQAIDECIREDVLKKFLVKCRGEVRNMVLSSFNQEIYERDLRAEGRAEGKIEGLKEGELKKLIQQVCRKLKKNKSPEIIADELEEELLIIHKICAAAKTSGGEFDPDHIFEQIQKQDSTQ